MTNAFKVVFTDFDGVLLTGADIVDQKGTHPQKLSVEKVARLTLICSVTGAGVVISSSWRYMGLHTCQEALKVAGFKGDVYGRTRTVREMDLPPTPGTFRLERHHEIQQWLKDNPSVDAWIAIDDHDMSEHLGEDHMVATKYDTGLLDYHVNQAVRKLKPSQTDTVSVLYKNWKGIVKWRMITPVKIEFKSTDWHKTRQWIMTAIDREKMEVRDFAMVDIIEWKSYE